MKTTFHGDTIIQGDSEVDLNFRPQIQVGNIILYKSLYICVSSEKKFNLIHFGGEKGVRTFLGVLWYYSTLGIVQPLTCIGSWKLGECIAPLATHFAKAGSPFVWGQPP